MKTEKQLIDKWTVIKLLRGKWIAKHPVPFYFGLIAAADEIEKLPEVVAAPVVHGRWIDRLCVTGHVYCSECATLEKATDSNYKSRHCPNCGAKMDGGENK